MVMMLELTWYVQTAMGQQPTEEELFQMISEVDEDMSGAIGMFIAALIGKCTSLHSSNKQTSILWSQILPNSCK